MARQPKRFKCTVCGKLWEPNEAERRWRVEGGDVYCPACQVAETEAENASLEAAETGAGREKLLDCQYHQLYGDE